MSADSFLAPAPSISPPLLAPRPIALVLFILTLALRLPFVSQTLNHWDSVNHALALTSFNVAAHRPQPPGYILYIGFARLVNFVFPDAQTALVIVSILTSGLAVAFLFLLGTRLSSPAVGLVAALLLLTSPPFWFDGEVALPYVVEGCASVVLALLLYKLLMGEQHLALLTAVVFAISIGLRQQMAFFFAPLVLYVYWHRSWRVRLEALAWFVLVCLLWFVPLMWSVGGIPAYLTALRGLNSAFTSEYVLFGTGGAGALARNALRMSAYTLYALNLSLAPLLIGGVLWLRAHSLRDVWHDTRMRFLALWIAPSAMFYLFFHMGSPGLIYVFLPALYLVTALSVQYLTRAQPRWRSAVLTALCTVNVFIFLGTPADLYLGRDFRALNYSALVAHDRSLTARVSAIRANLDPATTLILADDWRFAEYYLPDFRVVFVSPAAGEPVLVAQNLHEKYLRAGNVDVSQIEVLAWFDEAALKKYDGQPPDCVQMQNEECLYIVHLPHKGGVKILPQGVEELMP